MIRSLLLVAALLTLSAEASVLMRFINTVPTRTSVASVTDNSAGARVKPSTINPLVDRVGLQYFSQVTGSVASPTLVWTTILETGDITGAAAGSVNPTAPYAYYFAMPPLRAYHTILTSTTAETIAIDTPLSPNKAANNNNVPVDQYDVYEQTRLFADGVGLYLTFAAGTYQMQAYAAISTGGTDTAAATQSNNVATARAFQQSSASFTFVDGHVYTVIAYGTGQFGASSPLSGNTVQLALIEESIAPTTFGKGSLRFFHAISTSTSPIDIYMGSGVSASNQIATGIAFGTVSAYIDVSPGESIEFPVAQTGSTSNSLASSTPVKRDVRAGMRATVICGTNNDANSQAFCRAIPSRAVTYVRLVHDAAAQDSLVQGQFGAQKLSQTNLNLWACYEYPRPEQVVEQSQVMGNSVLTNHPATTDGLYPVVINVQPGTVSGYGEVFVPLFIMDFAVRFVITADNSLFRGVTGSDGYTLGTNADFTNQKWFFFAPVFKRVNYVIKTDGFATLTGIPTVSTAIGGLPYPFVGTAQLGKLPQSNDQTGFTAVNTLTYDLHVAITLDEYHEAGEFYTVFVQGTGTTTPVSLEQSGIVGIYFRKDRDVDTVASGITQGNGIFNLIPFGSQSITSGGATAVVSQSFTVGTFSIQLQSANTVPTSPNLPVVGANFAVPAKIGSAQVTSTATAEVSLAAGAYTYSFSSGPGGCMNTIPGSGNAITITAGQITDLFVLNTFGCAINNNDLQRLVVTFVTRQSAQATSNSPFPTTSSRAASVSRHAVAFTTYSAASTTAASFLLALIASALVALLAL